jgi:DNA-binding NarL/FixJ family response regulator
MSSQPISVLVVEDEALVRERAAQLIEADGRLVLGDLAGDGCQALTLTRELRPQVVLLGAFLPRVSGAEVLVRLRADDAFLGKVLLLAQGPTPELHDVILAGPDSMLYKRCVDGHRLCEEIVAVAAGAGNSTGRVLLREATMLALTRPDLTGVEAQLLGCLVDGLRVKDIPMRLHSSERVVEDRLRALREKLAATSNAAAVARAYDLGLLRPRRWL